MYARSRSSALTRHNCEHTIIIQRRKWKRGSEISAYQPPTMASPEEDRFNIDCELKLPVFPSLTTFVPGAQMSISHQSRRQSSTRVPYTETRSNRDNLWTYLQSCSVAELRTICESEQILQRARSKADLLKQSMENICDSEDLTKTWTRCSNPVK